MLLSRHLLMCQLVNKVFGSDIAEHFWPFLAIARSGQGWNLIKHLLVFEFFFVLCNWIIKYIDELHWWMCPMFLFTCHSFSMNSDMIRFKKGRGYDNRKASISFIVQRCCCCCCTINIHGLASEKELKNIFLQESAFPGCQIELSMIFNDCSRSPNVYSKWFRKSKSPKNRGEIDWMSMEHAIPDKNTCIHHRIQNS